jgi:phage-related protein
MIERLKPIRLVFWKSADGHEPSRREARVLFGSYDGMLIALTAFIKKTQATPASEIVLAQQRLTGATTS